MGAFWPQGALVAVGDCVAVGDGATYRAYEGHAAVDLVQAVLLHVSKCRIDMVSADYMAAAVVAGGGRCTAHGPTAAFFLRCPPPPLEAAEGGVPAIAAIYPLTREEP